MAKHPTSQKRVSELPVGKVRTVGGYPDESDHTVEWLCKYKDLKDGDLLYTAPQREEHHPECGRCEQTDRCDDDCDAVVIGGHRGAAEQQQQQTSTHWSHDNPGLADQYRAEALAARRSVGFEQDADDVAPTDIAAAIESLTRTAPDMPGLTEALRQYQHNDGSGLVFGYDKLLVDRHVAGLAEALEAVMEFGCDLKSNRGRWALEKAESALAAYRKGGCK